MADLPGVDLSHFQGNPAPITAIVNDGAAFVVLKATQANFIDPAFQANAAKLATTHAVKGAYHFLEGGNASAQAAFFAATVEKAWPHKDFFCWIDVENNASGPDPRFPDVLAFADKLNSIYPDKTNLIYTSLGYWLAIGNPDAGPTNCDLALASYVPTGSPQIGTFDTTKLSTRVHFGGWTDAAFRQFGPVDAGGLKRIDGDFFRGTIADLQAYAGVRPPKPPVPLVDRPRYKAGFNDMVEAVTLFAKTYKAPPTTNPADDAGAAAAKLAVLDALDSVTLG